MKKPVNPSLVNIVRSEILRQFCDLLGKLVTIQDISRRLQCHERTFYRCRKKWGFPEPAIREGKFVRWTPEQVATWEKGRTNGR